MWADYVAWVAANPEAAAFIIAMLFIMWIVK